MATLEPPATQVDTAPSAQTASVDAPPDEYVEAAEDSVVAAVLSPELRTSFGSSTDDIPAESPIAWAMLAAVCSQLRSARSLTDGNLLRTLADTGEDVGAEAMASSALAADNPVLVVDGSVGTGVSPSSVAVAGSRVYVTNRSAGTVTVFNRADHSVLATVPVGASPSAVVVNSTATRAYVANASAATVTVINTADYSVLATVKVGEGPSALALTPDGTRLLVTNATRNTVTKINTSNNTIATAGIAVGKGPSSVAVSADGKYAYVTNTTDGTVSLITLAYNSVKTVTGVGTSPTDVAVGTGGVYVSTLGGTISVISPVTNTVTGSLTVGAPLRSLAFNPNATQLLAATATDSVIAIDIASGAVVTSVTSDPSPDTISTPSLTVADDGRIYQTDNTDNALRILHIATPTDPTNHAPTATDPTVGNPDEQSGIVTGSIVATDPDGDTLTYTLTTAPSLGSASVQADGSFTYTPTTQARESADANTVDHFSVTVSDGLASVISPVTVTVLPLAVGYPVLVVDGSVGTGVSPSSVAVAGSRVYVTNRSAGTVTVFNRADHSVLATVPVGASPSAVVVNSTATRAYVANASAATVTVINTADYSVLATVKVGEGPSALALTPDGTRLLVTNATRNTVTKINTSNNTIATAGIAVGKGPSSVAVSADGKYAYVTNTTDGTVSLITLAYNSVKTVTGVGTSPTDVAVGTGGVYVSTLGGTISVISPVTNTVTGSLTVGAPLRSLAFNPNATQLLAATATDSVIAIDIASGAVVTSVTSDPSPDTISTPSLTVADDGRIYQTDNTDNALRILHIATPTDPTNHAPTATDPTVGNPDEQSGIVTGSIVATDPDGDTLTYTLTTAPKYGTLSLGANGSFTYTPSLNGRTLAGNSPGGQLADQFVVTVGDGRLWASSIVGVVVLPTESTLKTGTYSFAPPVVTLTTSSTAEYTRRKVMEFPVDPYKMRVHIANFNAFNYSFPSSGTLDDIRLYVGEAEVGADGMPNGHFVPGTQVQIPIAPTLVSGQWGTSDWLVDGKDFNFDPDKLYIFSYGFGTPGGSLTTATADGWGTTNAGDAGASTPTGLTATKAAYLDVWFEYQYADQGQPSAFVVAPSFAWSNSGAPGTLGELSTFPNQWAETKGGVIVGNIAVPGVFTTVFLDPDKRWNFYDDKVEIPIDPDAVLYVGINSNDAASDTTGTRLDIIEQHTVQVVDIGDAKFPNATQILSDIPPRIGFSNSAMDAERRAINAWTYGLPGRVDGVLRIADLLGDGGDPERLKPAYTLDGTHWTPAATAVVVQQIVVTYKPDPSPSAIPETVLASIAPSAPVNGTTSASEPTTDTWDRDENTWSAGHRRAVIKSQPHSGHAGLVHLGDAKCQDRQGPYRRCGATAPLPECCGPEPGTQR